LNERSAVINRDLIAGVVALFKTEVTEPFISIPVLSFVNSSVSIFSSFVSSIHLLAI
jgi:hypothetical protein